MARIADHRCLTAAGTWHDTRAMFHLQISNAALSPEVLDGGAQNLVSTLLPFLVCDAQHVPHEGRIALRIGQLVRVDVTNRPNDGLCRSTWEISRRLVSPTHAPVS